MKCQKGEKIISKKLWASDEDDLLKKLAIQSEEVNWAQISKLFNRQMQQRKGQGMIIRSNKQCRQRWQNHLNPSLNNQAAWTKLEHVALFDLFKSYGHQWSKISHNLESLSFSKRGDNNIKNYFYSSVKKALKRINEVIHEKNKECKKMKSEIYNYHQKYCYQQKLSLQRQIAQKKIVTPDQIVKQNSSQNQNQAMHDKKVTEHSELGVIRQLNPQIVSKIFHIAQYKFQDRFIHLQSKFLELAQKAKNQLIEYIKDNQVLSKDNILDMVKGILKISKNCKRRFLKQKQAKTQKKSGQKRVLAEQTLAIKPTLDSPKNKGNNELSEIILSMYLMEDNQKLTHPNTQNYQNNFIPSISSIPHRANQDGPLFNKNESFNFNFNLEGSSEYKPLIFNEIPLDNRFNSKDKSMANVPFRFQDFTESRQYKTVSPFVKDTPDFFISETFNKEKNKKSSQSSKSSKNINLMEYGFLNTIQQVQPKPKMGIFESQMMADFQIPFPLTSSYPIHTSKNQINLIESLNFKNQEEKLMTFKDQPFNLKRQSIGRLSNNSRSRTKKSKERQVQNLFGPDNLFRSQQIVNLNRSWAYSEPPIDTKGVLFTSNNYEHSMIHQTMLLKSSNFQPFHQ